MKMRISGFASGMDIESIVNDLMKVERLPLQKMEQEKQVLEWKRDDYRSINTLLLDFRDNSLFNMRLTTGFRARQVTSSNEDFITAVASSAANQTSFEISKVEQLATAASWVNDGKISSDQTNKIDASKSLYNEADKLANNLTWNKGVIEKKNIKVESGQTVKLDDNIVYDVDTSLDIQVNGKGFEVVDSANNLEANQVYFDASTGELTFADGAVKTGDTISAQYVKDNKTIDTTLSEGSNGYKLDGGSIVADSNFSLTVNGTNYSIGASTGTNEYALVDGSGNSIGKINTNSGAITFDEKLTETTDISVTYQQNYTSFSIGASTANGETHRNFIVSGNESLNKIVDRVNSAKLGVSMMYDSFSDQLTLSRTVTGDFDSTTEDIQVSGDFMTSVLQFSNNRTNYEEGTNAKFTINGLSTERHSNSFQIDGVTFSLKQTFDEVDGAQPVTIGVSNNTEEVFENIKEFVETYNTLIDNINNKLNEEYHRDYKPLTDEERESLSEKRQEDWEAMAKSGLLKGDPILQSVLSEMRRDFYTPVNNDESTGVFNQLAAIGITTTKDYMEGGKLVIDEGKLKEAIEADSAEVENLFRGDGDSYGEKGIVRRLTDSVEGAMDKIYERAGRATATNYQFTIGRNLEDIEDRISNFENRLAQVEERYWSQFTAMEQAIARYNQQSSYLMQQFGGGMS